MDTLPAVTSDDEIKEDVPIDGKEEEKENPKEREDLMREFGILLLQEFYYDLKKVKEDMSEMKNTNTQLLKLIQEIKG